MVCTWERVMNNLHYPFPSYKRFLTTLQQTAFWKHSDKRRNFSRREISPFATMFSTHKFISYPFNYTEFRFFWQNLFKVVCCKIVVWGKGINNIVQNTMVLCVLIDCLIGGLTPFSTFFQSYHGGKFHLTMCFMAWLHNSPSKQLAALPHRILVLCVWYLSPISR